MDEPILTVIMPLRNYSERFLRRAVASVRQQTCPAWRLVIVVEPADRQMFESLLHEETRDPRVEVIDNRGYRLAGAINSGMRAAMTEFVGLLLADDEWSVDAVETLGHYLANHPEADFFHSSRRYIDAEGHFISSVYRSRTALEPGDFKYGPVKHLLCWRRDKALSIGGLDESLSSLVGPDDYDFPWTMAENGARFEAVEECLYHYRSHCECFRLTTHTPLSVKHRELSRILKKHGVGPWQRLILRTRRYFQSRVGGPSLYRSSLHRWFLQRSGLDARRRWKPVRYK